MATSPKEYSMMCRSETAAESQFTPIHFGKNACVAAHRINMIHRAI